jgi:hypothetical protein
MDQQRTVGDVTDQQWQPEASTAAAAARGAGAIVAGNGYPVTIFDGKFSGYIYSRKWLLSSRLPAADRSGGGADALRGGGQRLARDARRLLAPPAAAPGSACGRKW